GWPAAVVQGPLGMAPWGQLTPRSIPFLTDEPCEPVRARSLGSVRRPEVVAAIHAGPYLMPGDVTSNRPTVDGLIATVLVVPRAGPVRLKRCSVAGGDPPTGETLRIFVDGQLVRWQMAEADWAATLDLSSGQHVVLIDWHGKTHDMDMTLAFSAGAD